MPDINKDILVKLGGIEADIQALDTKIEIIGI
jgi:hypothetical protein